MGGIRMSNLLELIQCILELGCIYSFVILSSYISMRILHIDDFAIEGSFALGGAITAWAITHHTPAFLATAAACCCGGISGCATGLIHTRLGANSLISGIVLTGAIFSINLAIVGPCVTMPQETLFDLIPSCICLGHLCMVLPIAGMLIFCVMRLLQTEIGLCFRACGENPHALFCLGKSPTMYKVSGIALSNTFSALAGSLLAQHTGFYSITGSAGTLILAIAGLLIGELLSSTPWLSILVGSIAYQSIVVGALELRFDPIWTKLISALLVVSIMIWKAVFSKNLEKENL